MYTPRSPPLPDELDFLACFMVKGAENLAPAFYKRNYIEGLSHPPASSVPPKNG